MPKPTAQERGDPFQNAAELRDVNVRLLEALNRCLEQDRSAQAEATAMTALQPQIRAFLERGAATGAVVEDIKERTGCQVLLDYWASRLSHHGLDLPRALLADFDATQLPDLKDTRCPFAGFDLYDNRAGFFGREKAVTSLLERVAALQLVVVQGAAGSGKSSIVIGAVLPVLGAADHDPRYRVVGPFTPGNKVLERLAEAMIAAVAGGRGDVAAAVATLRADPAHLVVMAGGSAAPPLLLVIDEFGEVLTLSDASDRKVLGAGLAALLQARPDDRVILTLREELSSQLDELTALRSYLDEDARFSMSSWPVRYEDLKASIEGPAAAANLQFQPGIVDDMVKNVLSSRDTALALLQFTLRLLWDKRDRNRITWDVYKEIGGSPTAALEKFAEGFYAGLKSDEERLEVERILKDLVRVQRMLESRRQPVLRSDLLGADKPLAEAVLQQLERSDFVRITPTPDGRDAVVEVKQEALLRNWSRYKAWIDAKRESVRERIALTEAAQRWERDQRSRTRGLLSGWQLQGVGDLHDLSSLETEYVAVSRRAVDRQANRKRWLFAVAGMVLVGLAWFVVDARQTRQDEQRELQQVKQEEQRQALLLTVAAAKVASASGKIDHALKLALKAATAVPAEEGGAQAQSLRFEVRAALLALLRTSTDLRRLYVDEQVVFKAVAFQPERADPLIAFAGTGGQVHLAGLGASAPDAPLDACGAGLVTALAFDPKGRWLAAGCGDGSLSLWATAGWKPLVDGGRKRVLDRTIWTLAASRDGRWLAAGGFEDRIKLVALAEDGRPLQQQPIEAAGDKPTGSVWSLAFSPQAERLLVGDGHGSLLACKTEPGVPWTCKVAAPASVGGDAIRALAFSPDGGRVAVGRWQGSVEVWDAGLAADSRTSIDVSQVPGPVYSLAFLENCLHSQLAIGKGMGLHYRKVGLPLPGPTLPGSCIDLPQASVGDEVHSVAVHAPSGLVAVATHGGYVAVLDPARAADRLRTTVQLLTTEGEQVRAAILDDQEGNATIAVPAVPTGAGRENLVLLRLKLRDGQATETDRQRLRAGEGEIRRLSTSAQGRRLATLTFRSFATREGPAVRAWDFDGSALAQAPLLELGVDDFGGLTPGRIALSPDGKWLVVAFLRPGEPKPGAPESERKAWPQLEAKARQLLVVAVADRGKTWLDSALQQVREIAFSQDGKSFAAGGDARQQPAGAGAGEVRLWSVGAGGFVRMPLPAMALTPVANKVYELGFTTEALLSTLPAAAEDRRVPLLLAGGEYGEIDMWELGTGRARAPGRVDSRPVWLLAFDSRGPMLAASDSQHVVRLWGMKQQDPEPIRLSAATEPNGVPGFLAFGGNGKWLASAAWLPGQGGRLYLWDLDIHSLGRKACELLRVPAKAPGSAWREDDRCHGL